MIKGTYTALVTPFNEDFSLDTEGFANLIEDQINTQVDGLVILGSTGENPTLTNQEKTLLIKTAVEAVAGRVHLMVGTGTNSTASTIEQTIQAKEFGADSALIVCPYYNKPSQEGLIKHFQEIAEKSNFPLCLYNVPGRTQVNLLPSSVNELLDIENIIGIKEASGNLFQMMEILGYRQAKRPEFSFLSGDDALTFPVICLGGQGVISVASNLVPSQIVYLVNESLKNNVEGARAEHLKLLKLFQTLFIESNPIPIKEAMRYLGKPAGPCRLPLTEISLSAKQALVSCINEYLPNVS